MSLPQPIFDIEPSERLRSLRQQRSEQRQRAARTARFRALGWEMTGRLAVNLVLTLVAFSALVKLIPYHQTQRQVLQEVETSLKATEAQNRRLRADFTRYFDPAQTSQVLQENGARESERHVPIVWVDKLPPSAEPPSTENPAASNPDQQ